MNLIDMDKLRKDMQETASKGDGDSIAVNEVFNTIWEQEKVNAIVISKGATNGDMISKLFPDFLFIPCEKYDLVQMLLYEDNENQKGLIECFDLDLNWWNSSYEGAKRMTKQEAINKLNNLKDYYNDKNEDSYVGFDNEDNEALDLAIKALDIELLTDTEQRIFLTAMNRERKVCQTVDDEYVTDSNPSLVEVCDSIERKVKKIWE